MDFNKFWKGYVFVDVDESLLKQEHDIGHGLTLRKATLREISDTNFDFNFKFWSEKRGTSGFINQRMPMPDTEKNRCRVVLLQTLKSGDMLLSNFLVGIYLFLM